MVQSDSRGLQPQAVEGGGQRLAEKHQLMQDLADDSSGSLRGPMPSSCRDFYVGRARPVERLAVMAVVRSDNRGLQPGAVERRSHRLEENHLLVA
jgi:hypothetical protein